MMAFRLDGAEHPVSPEVLEGHGLNEFAARWARRLGLPRGTFERDSAEPDASYRPRLLKMLSDTIEAP